MGQIDKFVKTSARDKPKNVDVVSVWRNNIWSFCEKWVWLLRQLKKKESSKDSDYRDYKRRIRNIEFQSDHPPQMSEFR